MLHDIITIIPALFAIAGYTVIDGAGAVVRAARGWRVVRVRLARVGR